MSVPIIFTLQDSAPDVFETTDEVDVALQGVSDLFRVQPPDSKDGDGAEDARTAAPTSDPKDIDVSQLPSRKAAGRTYTFESPGSCARALFPTSVESIPLTSVSDAELLVDRPPRKESHLARLRRLQSEIADLERDLQAGSSGTAKPPPAGVPTRSSALPPREPVDVVTELASVRERLSAVAHGNDEHFRGSIVNRSKDWEGRIRKLDSGVPVPNREEETTPEPSTANADPHRAGDIESRIMTLEKIVGNDQNNERVGYHVRSGS